MSSTQAFGTCGSVRMETSALGGVGGGSTHATEQGSQLAASITSYPGEICERQKKQKQKNLRDLSCRSDGKNNFSVFMRCFPLGSALP